MKAIIFAILLLAIPAHAALTIQGVDWPAENVLKVLVTSAPGQDPTAIEVPLEPGQENARTNGLITATVKSWPAAGPDERSLITIIFSQPGIELASLYILREKPDHQYEYAHAQPILDAAPSIKEDLTGSIKMLKIFNQCTEIGALEGLVLYKKAWPDQDVRQMSTAIEQQKVKRGENGACALVEGPKVIAPKATPAAAKPAAPRAPRVPRPRPAVDAYGNPVGRSPYAQPYGNPYGGGGYGNGGGYGGGYGNRGYGGGGGYGGYGNSGY